MKIELDSILDFLFKLFVFSSIVLAGSSIGKILQLISILTILFIILLKKTRFTWYNFLELIFVFYVYGQIFFDIAVLKSGTLKTANTILYNFSFILSMYNYIVYKKNITTIVEKYAKVTVFSLFILLMLYYKSLLSFRFDASKIMFGLIGGHSSTALSLIAAIPAFFLSMYGDQKNKKKNFIYIIILFIISFLTGTRKTLLIFAFIMLIVYPLKNHKVTIVKILKMSISIIIISTIMLTLMLKVPVVYKIIGYRVENAISIIINDQDDSLDASIRVRERMIRQSKQLFTEKQTTGWGMDYFRLSNQSGLGYYSHNNFMELLVGGGIIGFVLYYLKYLYLIFIEFKCAIRDKKDSKWFCLLFFNLIMILLEYWQVTYLYRYIIIYQAIILAIYTLEKSERKHDKNCNSL